MVLGNRPEEDTSHQIIASRECCYFALFINVEKRGKEIFLEARAGKFYSIAGPKTHTVYIHKYCALTRYVILV